MSTNTFYELLLQPHEDPPQTELANWWSVAAEVGEVGSKERKQKQKSGSGGSSKRIFTLLSLNKDLDVNVGISCHI